MTLTAFFGLLGGIVVFVFLANRPNTAVLAFEIVNAMGSDFNSLLRRCGHRRPKTG
jgi:hypothetical protein